MWHSQNVPCLFIKNLPQDGSLELKYFASYVLMIIYLLGLTQ